MVTEAEEAARKYALQRASDVTLAKKLEMAFRAAAEWAE